MYRRHQHKTRNSPSFITYTYCTGKLKSKSISQLYQSPHLHRYTKYPTLVESMEGRAVITVPGEQARGNSLFSCLETVGGDMEILHATMSETPPPPQGWRFFGRVKRGVEVFALTSLYLTITL